MPPGDYGDWEWPDEEEEEPLPQPEPPDPYQGEDYYPAPSPPPPEPDLGDWIPDEFESPWQDSGGDDGGGDDGEDLTFGEQPESAPLLDFLSVDEEDQGYTDEGMSPWWDEISGGDYGAPSPGTMGDWSFAQQPQLYGPQEDVPDVWGDTLATMDIDIPSNADIDVSSLERYSVDIPGTDAWSGKEPEKTAREKWGGIWGTPELDIGDIGATDVYSDTMPIDITKESELGPDYLSGLDYLLEDTAAAQRRKAEATERWGEPLPEPTGLSFAESVQQGGEKGYLTDKEIEQGVETVRAILAQEGMSEDEIDEFIAVYQPDELLRMYQAVPSGPIVGSLLGGLSYLIGNLSGKTEAPGLTEFEQALLGEEAKGSPLANLLQGTYNRVGDVMGWMQFGDDLAFSEPLPNGNTWGEMVRSAAVGVWENPQALSPLALSDKEVQEGFDETYQRELGEFHDVTRLAEFSSLSPEERDAIEKSRLNILSGPEAVARTQEELLTQDDTVRNLRWQAQMAVNQANMTDDEDAKMQLLFMAAQMGMKADELEGMDWTDIVNKNSSLLSTVLLSTIASPWNLVDIATGLLKISPIPRRIASAKRAGKKARLASSLEDLDAMAQATKGLPEDELVDFIRKPSGWIFARTEESQAIGQSRTLYQALGFTLANAPTNEDARLMLNALIDDPLDLIEGGARLSGLPVTGASVLADKNVVEAYPVLQAAAPDLLKLIPTNAEPFNVAKFMPEAHGVLIEKSYVLNGVKATGNALDKIADTQRAWTGMFWLYDRPGHGVRNATSAGTHGLVDWDMALVPMKTIDTYWDDKLGFMPNPRVATTEGEMMGARRGMRGAKNVEEFRPAGMGREAAPTVNLAKKVPILGPIAEAGAKAFYGRGPIGENAFFTRAWHGIASRVHFEEWKRATRRIVNSVDDLPRRERNKLARSLHAAGVHGNQDDVVKVIHDYIGGELTYDMDEILGGAPMSPDNYRQLRETIAEHAAGRLPTDQATAIIDDIFDNESELFSRIIAENPQPPRYVNAPRDEVADYAEIMRDAQRAAKEMGVDPKEATAGLKQTIEGRRGREEEGFASLLSQASRNPSPDTRRVVVDTWSEIRDLKTEARQKQYEAYLEAAETGNWDKYLRDIDEIWSQQWQEIDSVLVQAQSDMNAARKGTYTPRRPGTSDLIERAAKYTDEEIAARRGVRITGPGDPAYAEAIAASRAHQDKAAATMYVVAQRYGDDTESLNQILAAEQDVQRMTAEHVGRVNEVRAGYDFPLKGADREKYYSEMSELWNDYWDASAARYNAASVSIAESYARKEMTKLMTWDEPGLGRVTLVGPDPKMKDKGLYRVSGPDGQILDVRIREESIPPEALHSWKVTSGQSDELERASREAVKEAWDETPLEAGRPVDTSNDAVIQAARRAEVPTATESGAPLDAWLTNVAKKDLRRPDLASWKDLDEAGRRELISSLDKRGAARARAPEVGPEIPGDAPAHTPVQGERPGIRGEPPSPRAGLDEMERRAQSARAPEAGPETPSVDENIRRKQESAASLEKIIEDEIARGTPEESLSQLRDELRQQRKMERDLRARAPEAGPEIPTSRRPPLQREDYASEEIMAARQAHNEAKDRYVNAAAGGADAKTLDRLSDEVEAAGRQYDEAVARGRARARARAPEAGPQIPGGTTAETLPKGRGAERAEEAMAPIPDQKKIISPDNPRDEPFTRIDYQNDYMGLASDPSAEDMYHVLTEERQRHLASGGVVPPAVGDIANHQFDQLEMARQRAHQAASGLPPTPEHLTPQQQRQLLGTIPDLQRGYTDSLYVASKAGEEAANFTMLDPAHQRVYDTWIGTMMPYTYWPTRTVKNWMERSIFQPGILATYNRYDRAAREENRRSGVEGTRMEGTLPVPEWAPDWLGNRMSNPMDLLLPYGQVFFGNDFADPDNAKTKLGKIAETANYMGFSLYPLQDVFVQVAEGRADEIQAGDYIPIWRLLSYWYESKYGEPLPGGGSEWDDYNIARILPVMMAQGELTGEFPADQAQMIQDMLLQEQVGIGPIPEQGMLDQDELNRLRIEARKEAAQQKLLPATMSYMLGLRFYDYPQEEQDLRDAARLRRGLGYDLPAEGNEFGSKAAVDYLEALGLDEASAAAGYVFDENMGAEWPAPLLPGEVEPGMTTGELLRPWYSKSQLIPPSFKDEAGPPVPPTYPYKQPFEPERPAVQVARQMKGREKDALKAERDKAVDEFILNWEGYTNWDQIQALKPGDELKPITPYAKGIEKPKTPYDLGIEKPVWPGKGQPQEAYDKYYADKEVWNQAWDDYYDKRDGEWGPAWDEYWAAKPAWDQAWAVYNEAASQVKEFNDELKNLHGQYKENVAALDEKYPSVEPFPDTGPGQSQTMQETTDLLTELQDDLQDEIRTYLEEHPNATTRDIQRIRDPYERAMAKVIADSQGIDPTRNLQRMGTPDLWGNYSPDELNETAKEAAVWQAIENMDDLKPSTENKPVRPEWPGDDATKGEIAEYKKALEAYKKEKAEYDEAWAMYNEAVQNETERILASPVETSALVFGRPTGETQVKDLPAATPEQIERLPDELKPKPTPGPFASPESGLIGPMGATPETGLFASPESALIGPMPEGREPAQRPKLPSELSDKEVEELIDKVKNKYRTDLEKEALKAKDKDELRKRAAELAGKVSTTGKKFQRKPRPSYTSGGRRYYSRGRRGGGRRGGGGRGGGAYQPNLSAWRRWQQPRVYSRELPGWLMPSTKEIRPWRPSWGRRRNFSRLSGYLS